MGAKQIALDAMRVKLRARTGVGLEVGDGWLGLVRDLLDELDAISVKYCVAQIKEKFGGLRFYAFDRGRDTKANVERFRALVKAAEAKSFETCERCGGKGRLRTRGWRRTLCDKCDVIWKKETR